jgi:hypothetical protein
MIAMDFDVASALAKLSSDELEEVKFAARTGWEGGLPLDGDLKDKAVKLDLAYNCTGRLRPSCYKLFDGGVFREVSVPWR